jgi:hypothetical protein
MHLRKGVALSRTACVTSRLEAAVSEPTPRLLGPHASKKRSGLTESDEQRGGRKAAGQSMHWGRTQRDAENAGQSYDNHARASPAVGPGCRARRPGRPRHRYRRVVVSFRVPVASLLGLIERQRRRTTRGLLAGRQMPARRFRASRASPCRAVPPDASPGPCPGINDGPPRWPRGRGGRTGGAGCRSTLGPHLGHTPTRNHGKQRRRTTAVLFAFPQVRGGFAHRRATTRRTPATCSGR